MAIIIKGNNNGIAVDGPLKIDHIEFEPGKGIKSVSGVHRPQAEEYVYTEVEELSEEQPPSFNPLDSDKAKEIWRIARKSGLVDKHNKPLISLPKASILALVISQKLNLIPKWTYLEKLWGIKDLATLHSKASERCYYSDLLKQYSNLLG